MRNIYTALLAALLVVTMTSFAFAVDVATTFSGSYRVRGLALNNASDTNSDTPDHSNYYDQRFRLKITSAAGETVKGVLWFEVGDMIWGDAATGGNITADGKIVEVKNAYIEYKSDFGLFKVGMQPIILPKGLIVDDDIAAIMYAIKPSDELKVYAGILKGYDTTTSSTDKDMDGYVIGANYDLSKELMLGAYFAYCDLNTKSVDYFGTAIANDGAAIYWLGLTSVGKFGMVDFSADFIYNGGTISDAVVSETATEDVDLSAFAADLRAGVDIDAGVGLRVGGIFAYASGDDGKKADEANAFTVIAPTWDFNKIWSDGKFGGLGLNNKNGIANYLGFMGFGLNASVKPMDKLTAGIAFTNFNYVEEDANDKTDIGNEIDLDATYKLTDNLKLYGEIAYLMPGESLKKSDKDDPISEFIWCLQYDF